MTEHWAGEIANLKGLGIGDFHIRAHNLKRKDEERKEEMMVDDETSFRTAGKCSPFIEFPFPSAQLLIHAPPSLHSCGHVI
jgi:hypothetical protein